LYITEWCPVVPNNQITRLSFPILTAALDAWEVEYSKNGRGVEEQRSRGVEE